MRFLKIILIMFLAITLYACGGGGGGAREDGVSSEAVCIDEIDNDSDGDIDCDDSDCSEDSACVLLISSVVDGNSTPATIAESSDASANEGIYPTEYTVTFSEELADIDAAESAISLDCGDLEPVISTDCSDTICSVSVAEAWRYALLECDLVVGTGTGLSEAKTYAHTNGCAVNDDFNADSQGCWTVNYGPMAGTWDNWDDILANVLTFNTSSGTLDFDSTGQATESRVVLVKSVTGSSSVSIIFHFASVSGWGYDGGAEDHDEINLLLGTSSLQKSIILKVIGDESGQNCEIKYQNSSEGIETGATTDCSAGGDHYIKLEGDSAAISAQHSTDGIHYSDMENDEEYDDPMPEGIDLTDMRVLFIGVSTDTVGADPVAEIDEIITTGITSDTQY